MGFLNIRDDELLLYRVRDINTKRNLWQRMLGVGTVTIVSSDSTQPTLVLKNIKDPITVKELIHKQVEDQKIKRRVRVNEISHIDDDDVDDLDNDDSDDT